MVIEYNQRNNNKERTTTVALTMVEGKRIQIEFVSANPTGPLNIVSGRAGSCRGYTRQLIKCCRL